MAKIGDKRHYPRRYKDIDSEEDSEEQIREVIDQENEGITKRINNQRIPTFE